MQEIDYEVLRKNPKLLEEVADIDDDRERLGIYREAIKGSNRKIEDIEEAIDEARIEFDRKLKELRKKLEAEKAWKEKITRAKDELIRKIEESNKRKQKAEIPEEPTLEEYDEQGYNSKGYDAEGVDRNGFDVKGIHKETGTKYGPEGFNKYGYDPDGYDREGYEENGQDREGYYRDGYNSFGYNREGFDKEGNYDPIWDMDHKLGRKEKEEKLKELSGTKKGLDVELTKEKIAVQEMSDTKGEK